MYLITLPAEKIVSPSDGVAEGGVKSACEQVAYSYIDTKQNV